ncbi:hypothetical protein [Bacillus thuringiensis]
MPIYKDKERGTYYVKIVYRDYEGNKKQKKTWFQKRTMLSPGKKNSIKT